MKSVIQRVLVMPVLVWLVATLCFFLMRAAPGGPFDRERAPASPEVEAALRARYHLDEPLGRQYVRFLGQLVRGDLGPSLKYRNHSVNDILRQAAPVSAVLGLLAFCVALGIGIPLGVWSAMSRGGMGDWVAGLVIGVGICVPTFVLGPLLVLIFALWLEWLPVALWGSWKTAVLPSCALGLFFAARVARLMREGMLGAWNSPFVMAARARGLSEFALVTRQAFRIGVLPVVSYCGPLLADLLTGSFVIENVFQIPGTGAFFINSFFSRDYPMMIGLVILQSGLLLVLNLAVDLIHGRLDPRTRHD
jgi:oligopeptide transport system permease protein